MLKLQGFVTQSNSFLTEWVIQRLFKEVLK